MPSAVLLDKMGEWIRERASREVLSDVVDEIVKKENLKIVYHPVISKMDYKFGEQLKFEAIFEIEPTISLKSYKGLNLERRVKPVGEASRKRSGGSEKGDSARF